MEASRSRDASDVFGALFLLGAGASAEAGIPTTFEMTRRLVEGIEDQGGLHYAQVLNFVCGALIAHDAAEEGKSPYEGLDVERVFAAVELLAERRDLEVTPLRGILR